MKRQGQILLRQEEYSPGELQEEEDCDGPGWPGEEKHLQLAQLQQDGGHPACEVQAVLQPINQPPAACEAVHLSHVSFSDTNMSVVWFGWQQPRLLRKFMISRFNRSLWSCS